MIICLCGPQLDPGTVTLTMAEIQAAYPDIRLLVGSSFYIKASVMTESGEYQH